jgi:hypothetical protein
MLYAFFDTNVTIFGQSMLPSALQNFSRNSAPSGSRRSPASRQTPH